MNQPNSISKKDFEAVRNELGRILDETLNIAQVELESSRDSSNKKGRVVSQIQQSQQKLKNQSFQVAILGLAKSGKSTLLNAWLGNEYLPSSNKPETARIVRICHSPDKMNGVLNEENEIKAEGATEIRKILATLNENFRSNYKSLKEDELVLEAPFFSLGNSEFGEQKFNLLDTPGPNEAGAEILKGKVNRLLGDVDVIVYLLDYTKLNTEEEKEIFGVPPAKVFNFEL